MRYLSGYFKWVFFTMIVVALATSSAVQSSAVEIVPQDELNVCLCDYLAAYSGYDVPCKVTLCVKTASGLYCDVVFPGERTLFPCDEMIELYVMNIHGDYIRVEEGCVRRVAANIDCMVDVCLVRDVNGCLIALIHESVL